MIDNNIMNFIQTKYQKLFLQKKVKAFDKYNDYDIEPIKINIKKYIEYVACAQDNVTSATIENCQKKVDILPNYDDDYHEDHNTNIELKLECLKKLEEVQVLINKLDFKDSLTTDKFIQYDKSEITCEMISDEKIIKAIHSDNQKNQKKKIKTSLSQITYDEVIESYDKMILYLE